jgi:hypothetical protein
MNKRLLIALATAAAAMFASESPAAITINSTNAYSWGANIGWLNWRPSTADGVSIGRYICSGYIYGANVGWINLGNGNPANHIQYANNSATDFGVNFTLDPANSGHGLLRGFAYGANIGWINFEATGNPYVIISNGQLRGFVWSANTGWINLEDVTFFVSTDTIDPGVDSDGNGLADAWEYTYFGHIGVDPNADPDGDGESNLSEYRSGTNPNDPNSVARTARQLNIATRLRVLTGDNALIGGFIVTGSEPKRVILRAIAPSISGSVPGTLADPTLDLRDAAGTQLAFNDNWRDTQQAEIQATGIPPSDDRESAIVRTLAPGNYTAILRGNGDETGVAVVEVYDLGNSGAARLANISTRGFVQTGDNIMIGGFIVGGGLGNGGAGSEKVLVRGIGPSLSSAGISGALPDPTLELRDGSGTLIASNDNWKDSQRAEIEATGIPPTNDLESALVRTIPAGNYTAILRGSGGSTGVAVVEAYNLP